MTGTVAGPDGLLRCPWALSTEDYVAYHDTEWGRPVHGDDALYERLCLEAFQSGLSWLTILRRREGFRKAFSDFSIAAVAEFDDRDAERLLADEGIIRNRAKIEATLANAKVLAYWEPGELDALIWSHAPGKPGPAPHTVTEVPHGHPGVHRPGQGPEEGGHPLRRPHHGLCPHAGLRPGQRPPDRLRLPRGLSLAGAKGPQRPRYFGGCFARKAWTAMAWSSEAPARVWTTSSRSSASVREWVAPYARDSFRAA